jgi:hypothetical protein
MNKGLSRSWFEKIAGPGVVEQWDATHPPCKEQSKFVRADGGCLKCDADAGEACRKPTPILKGK